MVLGPKHRGFELREPWIQILPPPFDSFVILGILFVYLLDITQNEFMFRWGNSIMWFNDHSDIQVCLIWLPPTPPSTRSLSPPPHPGLLHVTTLIRFLSIFPVSFNENPAIMNLFSYFPFLIQRIMCVFLHNDFFSFNSIGIIIQTLRALVFFFFFNFYLLFIYYVYFWLCWVFVSV